MTQEIRRLYRAVEDSRLAGVCAGLGEYVGIDPVVVRLIWVAVTCVTGFVPGILAYLVAWLIVPPRPVPRRAPEATAHPHEGPA